MSSTDQAGHGVEVDPSKIELVVSCDLYRLLAKGEVIENGDQFLMNINSSGENWIPHDKYTIGSEWCKGGTKPTRRLTAPPIEVIE